MCLGESVMIYHHHIQAQYCNIHMHGQWVQGSGFNVNQGYDSMCININHGYDSMCFNINQGYDSMCFNINHGYDSMCFNINHGYDSMCININQGYDSMCFNINQGYDSMCFNIKQFRLCCDSMSAPWPVLNLVLIVLCSVEQQPWHIFWSFDRSYDVASHFTMQHRLTAFCNLWFIYLSVLTCMSVLPRNWMFLISDLSSRLMMSGSLCVLWLLSSEWK